MKNSELLEQISNKLSVLIAVTLQDDSKKMSITDGERLLRRFGLDNQSVADILGTTKQSIEVTKSRNQKRQKRI